MALPTPHRLERTPAGRQLSLASSAINTASHPNLGLAASTAIARKASLNALTAGAGALSPTHQGASGNNTPNGKMLGSDGREIFLGDLVDVPGSMHGVVKFIGQVQGKRGNFAGVELSKEYAPRGKNDGDVDGIRYFSTTIPGSGIFLPVSRASRRSSGHSSDYPLTPSTPSFADSTNSPSHPSLPKFAQSVGPGVRPPSPLFKPKGRQSLPRPGSPLRKGPVLAPPPTPGRTQSSLSKSQIGGPRFAPGANSRIIAKTPQPTKSYSRVGSRTGNRTSTDTSNDVTPTGPTRSSNGSITGSASSASGFTPAAKRLGDDSNEEIQRLRKQLEERDSQLKEQASSLAEMEAGLQELESAKPKDHGRLRSNNLNDEADNAQLRAVIREKNEKISILTAEFDNHRADFRSTIDTLEMASTETERVYEKRVEELLQEMRELQERSEVVVTVAQQLKQLEELVQELEEGLEDARRGEAEARSEVEFLRGEVERTRAELRREREKAAAVLKSAEESVKSNRGSKDLEQRDDEIRGLKAIIHSLSSGPDLSESSSRPGMSRNSSSNNQAIDADEVSRMQASMERLEREKKELQGLVERKVFREEELEREVEKLLQQRSSVISNAVSDKTTTQDNNRNSRRDSKGTVHEWRNDSRNSGTATKKPQLASMAEAQSSASSTTGSATLWCEICETGGHDILTCPNIDGSGDSPQTNGKQPVTNGTHDRFKNASISSMDPDKPRPLATSAQTSSSSLRTPLQQKPLPSPPLPMSHGRSSFPPPPGAAPTGPLPNPMAGTLPVTPIKSPVGNAFGAAAAATASPSALTTGKDGSKDANKWCAICEQDGHDSINCPLDDEF